MRPSWTEGKWTWRANLRSQKASVLCILFSLLFCPLRAHAAVGYLFATSESGKIYRDASGTGNNFVLVGNTPIVFDDITYDPNHGRLFAIGRSSRTLYVDNTGTGANFELVGSTPLLSGQRLFGLAYDPNRNMLLGAAGTSFAVDYSGDGTSFQQIQVNAPAGLYGLAFDARSNILYASNEGLQYIYHINVANLDAGEVGWAAAAWSGKNSGYSGWLDVGFNDTENILLGVRNDSTIYASPDQGGSFTLIGSTPEPFVGLTYALIPVPEPSTMILLGLGALILGKSRRRH